MDSLVAGQLLNALRCGVLQSTVLVYVFVRLERTGLGVLTTRVLLRNGFLDADMVRLLVLKFNGLWVSGLLLAEVVSRPDLIHVACWNFRRNLALISTRNRNHIVLDLNLLIPEVF